jgi:acetoin utilization deacetylase AcuC-like enzyme
MKVKTFFNQEFYSVYTDDPAAEEGRIEAVYDEIEPISKIIIAGEADHEDIARVHDESHIQFVKDEGLYEIAAIAAGCTIEAAKTGLEEPSFALVRPPGHHASGGSSWGFCYFNNVAVALEYLKANNLIETAFVLDFDMHYGDGTENILGDRDYVTILNPASSDRNDYMQEIESSVSMYNSDMIAISAGFDNHINDWGGLLYTEDYYEIGRMIRQNRTKGVFAALEGGYNHNVIGKNTRALLSGLSGL